MVIGGNAEPGIIINEEYRYSCFCGSNYTRVALGRRIVFGPLVPEFDAVRYTMPAPMRGLGFGPTPGTLGEAGGD